MRDGVAGAISEGRTASGAASPRGATATPTVAPEDDRTTGRRQTDGWWKRRRRRSGGGRPSSTRCRHGGRSGPPVLAGRPRRVSGDRVLLETGGLALGRAAAFGVTLFECADILQLTQDGFFILHCQENLHVLNNLCRHKLRYVSSISKRHTKLKMY